MQEKKKNPRNAALLLDLLHVVIGLLVVICAVLAFINPEQNRIMFPVIFALAAVMNGVNGWVKLRSTGHGVRSFTGGILQCLAAAALLAIGIVSMISIWR
jgi:uncharacterized membrane protein HdeD (DUF308 family)